MNTVAGRACNWERIDVWSVKVVFPDILGKVGGGLIVGSGSVEVHD